MHTWTPITEAEPQKIIDCQLLNCSAQQRDMFFRHRVPFYKVPINRGSGLESVFVIAELENGFIYYEDVEEGFEYRIKQGQVNLGPECNQFELGHILTQLENKEL